MPISSMDNSDECSEESDEFARDMDALKRACLLTGSDPSEVRGGGDGGGGGDSDSGSESEENDDLKFVRNVQEKLSLPQLINPLAIRANSHSDSDYEDNDFAILSAIQRRFTKYESDNLKEKTGKILDKAEVFSALDTPLKEDLSSSLLENRKNTEELDGDIMVSDGTHALSEDLESFGDTNTRNPPFDFIEYHCPQYEAFGSSRMPREYSGIPKSARLFIEALKKNRLCQKLIRSKMMHLEARIEENRELRGRIKCLVDFQVSCKRQAGRILGQTMDARVKLISLPKDRRNSGKAKDKDGITPAIFLGPAENSQVSNYKMVFSKLPSNLKGQQWSKEQKEGLINGVKQQFQEAVLRKSMEIYSVSKKFSGDPNLLDKIIESITDLEITPENTRTFLPQVDWERLASMYVKGRSGVECEARWLNFEDPMINRNPWTKQEDKNLLYTVQQRGLYNWIDIAIALGSNRSPSQCLSRYQRSLNAHILKKEWTESEDAQLRALVEALGEGDWQIIASNLEGRTGSQCLDRWRKVLNPSRKRVGRWTVEEDKRLKIAVMLFGPKTWKKIAHFVPGRTQVQCRERWRDVLDPSLKLEEWTEEEDFNLKEAIARHGHCWSKVAACVPPRTDSQCRRRWKVLFPEEVHAVQMAREIHKSALISNFVGREKERPEIGPNDFLPPPEISLSEAKNVENKRKQKKKSSNGPKPKKQKDGVSCNTRKQQKKRYGSSCAPEKASSKKPGSTRNPDTISTTNVHESLVVSESHISINSTEPNLVSKETLLDQVVSKSYTSINGTEQNFVSKETMLDQDVPTNIVFQKKKRKSKPLKLSWRRERCMEAADDDHASISRGNALKSKKRKGKASCDDPRQVTSKKSRIIDKNHPGGISLVKGDGALLAAGETSMNNRDPLKSVSSSGGCSELDEADMAVPHLEPSGLGTRGAALDGTAIPTAPSVSVSPREMKREIGKCTDVSEQDTSKISKTEDNNHSGEIAAKDGDGALVTSNGVYRKELSFADEELEDNIRNKRSLPMLISGRDGSFELGGDPHPGPSFLDVTTTNGAEVDGIATTTEPSPLGGTISLRKLKHELRIQKEELPFVTSCNRFTEYSCKEVAKVDPRKDGVQNLLDNESNNAGAGDVSCLTASLTSGLVGQFPSGPFVNSGEETDILITGKNLPKEENPSILPILPQDSCGQNDNGRHRSRRASRRNINYKDMLNGITNR